MTDPVIVVDRDILPVFVFDEGEPYRPVAFEGTGFVAAPGVFVTCWHCVASELPAGRCYGVAVSAPDGYRMLRLLDIAQDVNGKDLATARIDALPSLGLGLAGGNVASGVDVLTYGYPLTRSGGMAGDGLLSFTLESRYLQGYVTRLFWHEQPGLGRTPAYELDMQAPAGLSGAPLIERGRKRIVGVIYGSTESYTIQEEASVNLETGDRHPEVRKLVTFALAHTTDSVRALAGPATQDRPLADLLETT